MLDIARGRNPQPEIVLGAWNTTTGEIIGQKPELSIAGKHYFLTKDHLALQGEGGWMLFDFPPTTTQSELAAAQIEVSTVLRRETLREHFLAKSIVITETP